MSRTGRALAIAIASAVSLTPVIVHAQDATSGDAAVADVPEDVPASKRLYMVTDSVGLGAQWALPATFGPGWQITIDGDPG